MTFTHSAGDKFSDYMVTNTIVSANGNVLWLYPALIKTYCTLNVQNFPFDQQNCIITFISWTHSGDQLDVQYNDRLAATQCRFIMPRIRINKYIPKNKYIPYINLNSKGTLYVYMYISIH